MKKYVFIALLILIFILATEAQIKKLSSVIITPSTEKNREMVEGPVICQDRYFFLLPKQGIQELKDNGISQLVKRYGYYGLTATKDYLYFASTEVPHSMLGAVNPSVGTEWNLKTKDKFIQMSPYILNDKSRGFQITPTRDGKSVLVATIMNDFVIMFKATNTQEEKLVVGRTLEGTSADTMLHVQPFSPMVYHKGMGLNIGAYKRGPNLGWRYGVTLSYKTNPYLEENNETKFFFKGLDNLNLLDLLVQTDDNVYTMARKMDGKGHNIYRLYDLKMERVQVSIPDTGIVWLYEHNNNLLIVSDGNFSLLDEKKDKINFLASSGFDKIERIVNGRRILFTKNYFMVRNGSNLMCVNLKDGSKTLVTSEVIAASQSLMLRENEVYAYRTDNYFYYVKQGKEGPELYQYSPEKKTSTLLPFPADAIPNTLTYIHGTGKKLLIMGQKKLKKKDDPNEHYVYSFTEN